MDSQNIISENLKKAIAKIAKKDIEFSLQASEKSENGDYYTNVAMRLSSILKKKPLDIAYEIKEEIEKGFLPSSQPSPIKGEGDQGLVIEKIEVVAPGFVNFFLSEPYLTETVKFVNKKGESFGGSETLKNQKVMIEFTDPNPFKEFHIGHVYANLVGESLCRLFESQGAQVRRVCYQGDVGLHVAKAVYGMLELSSEMPDAKAQLSTRAQFMGRAYAKGAKTYESDEAVKKEIHALNKKIYDRSDKDINKLYDMGRAWSLEYFEAIYKRLGTKFERYYFESEVGPEGLKIVREFLKKKVFEESEGAIIFPGEKFGLHNRVFINSLGLPTYEAKDLGLAPLKFSEFAYDRSIIITAQEQAGYFKVILSALAQVNPDLAKRTTHISHGMVRLPSGKMSSRTGDVITGEWLIDEAVTRVRKAYPDMDEITSEKVALAAIKFAFLKSIIGRDISFSFEESIALEGASGPYLLYTYVRTQSVINKSHKPRATSHKPTTEDGLNPEEKDVLRQLVYFPEIVSMAQEKLSPNLVAEYLFDLSQKFNLFYQKHKIADNKFRLELSAAVGQTLKNGLNLLGIETVRRM